MVTKGGNRGGLGWVFGSNVPLALLIDPWTFLEFPITGVGRLEVGEPVATVTTNLMYACIEKIFSRRKTKNYGSLKQKLHERCQLFRE